MANLLKGPKQLEHAHYGSTKNTRATKSHNHKDNEPHHLIGIFFIMLGAFSFSVMFLLVKVMGPNANTFTLVLYRSLVQILISYAKLLYTGENPLGPPECRFWLIVRGIFGSGAVCAWFFGIQILPLPDAVTLQFTTPAFAALIAVWLVGEKWLPLDQIGAVVCLLGVAFIAHPTWLFGNSAVGDQDDSNSSNLFLKALAVMITEAGAAMAGIAYVSVRKIGHRASAVVMVLYYGSLSVPMCIIGSGLLQGDWNPFFLDPAVYTLKDYFLLLLMGLGGYGGQWFTNLGLQHESAATATLATCTQIVWTYIFELLFLHEGVNSWSLAGTGLILGYMLIVAFFKMLEARVKEQDKLNELEKTPLLPVEEESEV